MRKPDAASSAASKKTLAGVSPVEAPLLMVCLALALALVALGARIVTIW
jgi:hypothetical protein